MKRKNRKWQIEVDDNTVDIEFAPTEADARENFNGRTINRAWNRHIVKIWEVKR